MDMKMIITEKQLKNVKSEIDEQSTRSMKLAEKIYDMVKKIPFHDRDRMIMKIASMIDK